MYLSESPVSAVAEQLARFRGRPFRAAFLRRRGRPLALARYVLRDTRSVLDLDDPTVLVTHGLRPSQIATRNRTVTQAIAAAAFDADPDRGGLRWWSTLEASWINVTLFAERVGDDFTIDPPAVLDAAISPVADACRFLGLSAP